MGKNIAQLRALPAGTARDTGWPDQRLVLGAGGVLDPGGCRSRSIAIGASICARAVEGDLEPSMSRAAAAVAGAVSLMKRTEPSCPGAALSVSSSWSPGPRGAGAAGDVAALPGLTRSSRRLQRGHGSAIHRRGERPRLHRPRGREVGLEDVVDVVTQPEARKYVAQLDEARTALAPTSGRRPWSRRTSAPRRAGGGLGEEFGGPSPQVGGVDLLTWWTRRRVRSSRASRATGKDEGQGSMGARDERWVRDGVGHMVEAAEVQAAARALQAHRHGPRCSGRKVVVG